MRKFKKQSVSQNLTTLEDASTIIRCMAENWKEGEAQIQACRDCFKAVEETDAGLVKAKECVAQYLKMENEVAIMNNC